MRNELEEQASGTAAGQEVRAKRESELARLKQQLDDETKRYESTLSEVREKHHRQVQELQDQLDAANKV